jgi:hypothetical protein
VKIVADKKNKQKRFALILVLLLVQHLRKEENRMALEDYMEPEIAVTAAVTAAVLSPRGRKVIRRSAVYGLAGVIAAGDAISSFSHNIKHGIQEASTAAVQATRRTVEEAKAGAAEAAQEAHANHSIASQSDGEIPATQ